MPLELRGIDLEPIREDAGAYTIGRAVTAMLRVSANGNNRNGSSWTEAYRTIQGALDAASMDPNDLTLILISPHPTFYDINLPGNPTWSANVRLQGTQRKWGLIKNTHVSATSILKLTGKAMISDLDFNLDTANDGVILTNDGARVYRSLFVGSSLTSARTALHLDHASGGKYAKIIDCDFFGKDATKMTAVLIDQFGRSEFDHLHVHYCLKGIQIVGANSDDNHFIGVDIGESALALDLDAGNEQHFDNLTLHGNTTNVDDEVGDHIWSNIIGAFPIHIEPNNLVGVQVNAGAANTYGGDTQIRAAVTSTVPFRIVGIHIEPSANEWYQLRFSTDAGVTFYDILQFDATKREGIAAPSGTEFIFNVGTRISASVKSVTGGNNTKVWLEIQEI